MTPKEKAQQLVDKMVIQMPSQDATNALVSYVARGCALVTVDEIIANIEPSVSMDIIESRVNYWNKVKNEIEKA